MCYTCEVGDDHVEKGATRRNVECVQRKCFARMTT